MNKCIFTFNNFEEKKLDILKFNKLCMIPKEGDKVKECKQNNTVKYGEEKSFSILSMHYVVYFNTIISKYNIYYFLQKANNKNEKKQGKIKEKKRKKNRKKTVKYISIFVFEWYLFIILRTYL